MGTVDTTLAGRYRLEEVVGRGGMSTVYRATDRVLGRTVAVKILLPALADQDPAYAVRFEREARAAAALASSALVTVYDTGVDDTSHYIVMEYIAGRSLDQVLRDRRPLDTREALRITARIADALAVAHAAGILHRDIKPANVMLADDGSVKVLDFGIARRLDGTMITQAASVVGTAAYMAPERALGEPGDERADVYSLGCLLYAMLTGSPPFNGEISAAVLHQQINAEPQPPSQLRSGVAPSLDALILSMLAKSPDARPATAAEVRDRITALARVRVPKKATVATAAMGPESVGAAALAPVKRETAATASAGVERANRRPGGLTDHRRRALVMALLTGALALIAVALLGPGSSSKRAANTGPRTGTTVAPAPRPARSQASAPAQTTAPGQAKHPPAKPKAPHPAKPSGHGPPPGHGGTPPGHGGPKGAGDGG